MTIPAGKYKVRAVHGSEQYGRSSGGTEQINVDVEFIGGEQEGATATVFLYLSDAAVEYSIAKLRALGWKGDKISELTGLGDTEAHALVKYETYQGEERMKVDILAGGMGRVKVGNPMDPRAKSALDARLAAKIKAAPAKGTADDDLAF